MSTLLDRESRARSQAGKPGVPNKRKLRLPRLARFKRRTYIVGGAIFALLAAIAIYIFYFSSLFALESLVVEGVKDVDPKKVGNVADLTPGTPLAAVDVGDVREKVGAIPSVASVAVSLRWPHTIVISIVERQRVAGIADGDQFAVVDQNGNHFLPSRKRPVGLPLLEVAEDGPIRASAVAVLASLPEDIKAIVDTVSADRPDMVVLKLHSGVIVMWGGPDETDLKAQVLRALMDRTNDQWFDVRTPTSPTSAGSSPRPVPPPPTESPTPAPSDSQAIDGVITGTPPGDLIPAIPSASALAVVPAPSASAVKPSVAPTATPRQSR